MNNMYSATLRGAAHLLGRRPCEDAAASACMNNVSAICIADGASCCTRAGETSHALARACADFLAAHFQQLYQLPDHLVAQKLLALIRNVQQELVDQLDCTVEDCGSTLIGVAANHGQYLAVKLGDGTVISQRKDGSCIQLIKPDKGESAHATYLTVHPDDVILEHMRILRGRWTGTGFIATSDGLEDILYSIDGDVSEDASVMLALAASGQGDEIVRAIGDGYLPDDDVSIAMLIH